MKTKIFIVFILVAFACLPLKALAYERNFPAGSIIIPMDASYQPETHGGLLEAYGLVYYLLDYQDPNSECMIAAAVTPATDEDVIACQADCADSDTACEQACIDEEQEKCRDVTVSWVINGDKTTVDGIDLVIEDTTLPRVADGIDAVVKLYNHDDTTSELTFNAAEIPADTVKKITYRGSLWIIDVDELADGVEAQVYALINSASWDAVNVHVAQVPFAAPVFRDMLGTPPKIALMNSGEDKTKGNASILESYLRLAGICSDSYEIVTPNEIAGLSSDLTGTPIDPVLGPDGPGYDFLWAPHWDGEKNYDGTGNYAHRDNVVGQIREFLQTGTGMLAECASIETFEHNSNGHFLTTKGLGHNGVDVKDETHVVYTNVEVAYSQIGDFSGGFDPEGGHLHNWRPYHDGDPYNFDPDFPNVDQGKSVYNHTVKRFTTDTNGTDTVDDDWDYFVGGYTDGNTDFGYVVYLGGHSYAKCDTKVADELVVDPEPNAHPMFLEFTKEVYDADFTLQVDYKITYGGSTVNFLTAAVPFASDDLTAKVGGWDGEGALQPPLQIDFTTATVDKGGKKFYDVTLKNTFPVIPLDIQKITLAWVGGAGDLKIKKLIDEKTDVKHYDEKGGSASAFNLILNPGDFVIDEIPPVVAAGDAAPVGCTNNSGCEFKNLAGVRYVLNTLFNIKYEMDSPEYVRSAPIVAGDWLYQGTFKHPSLTYEGHFRRYKVWCDPRVEDWDTGSADIIEINIPDAGGGNPDPSPDSFYIDARTVYTAKNINEVWSKIPFDAAHVDELITGLDVYPDNSDTADEIKVIGRLRGLDWIYENQTGQYVQRTSKRLGGIMHSAPVIVRNNVRDSRFDYIDPDPDWERPEVAYVGDLYGMLHAIDTGGPGTAGDPDIPNDKTTCGPESGGGKELWAYIPSNLLGKLKNDRTDPNADPDFAAVDGSPTAKDIYWDHDGDGDSEWRTILVGTQGFGGNSIFALDVTDPVNFDVLWEATDDQAPGGGMGYSFRAALDKIKVPVYQDNDPDSNPIPIKYEVKWMVYVATSFVDIALNHGGINVFAFDLETGSEQWTFSSTYADSVNDIPGAVTTHDIDNDTLADRLYVGDMNGRMWEIALTDDPSEEWEAGESVHIYDGPTEPAEGLTQGMAIPLFTAGIGNPISVSPAIINRNDHVLLVFGTGGADWAANDKFYYVYAVDATEADRLEQSEKNANYKSYDMAIKPEKPFIPWKLKLEPAGEKIWSSPTISAGEIWIVTTFGSLESADPKSDRSPLDYSKLRVVNLDGELKFTSDKFGKVRGSIYISRKHAYMTTFEGEIIQLGDEDFSSGTGNRVVLKSWQDR